MQSHVEAARRASRDSATTPGILLVALGAWAVLVPYIGPVLDIRLDVASKVEFADHVVPGTVAVLSGALLLLAVRARGGDPSSALWLVAAGASFLAGVWMVSTHVPLLAQASRDQAQWGAALLHNSPGLPIAALSLWLLAQALRAPGAPRS